MTFFQQQNILEIFQQNPSHYAPIAQLVQNLMRGTSTFTEGERELIAVYVSALNSCDYCFNAHQKIAVNLKVDPKLLEAIEKTDTNAVDERFRPILALVKKLTLTPNQITQADVDNVLAAGWNEQAVKDAIAICSLFNFMNRLVDGYGLKQPSPEQLTAMATGINTHGYQAVLESNS